MNSIPKRVYRNTMTELSEPATVRPVFTSTAAGEPAAGQSFVENPKQGGQRIVAESRCSVYNDSVVKVEASTCSRADTLLLLLSSWSVSTWLLESMVTLCSKREQWSTRLMLLTLVKNPNGSTSVQLSASSASSTVYSQLYPCPI